MFCSDTDLLRWEPTIFAEAAFASQTLLTADCTLAGTTLTLSGAASFETSRVRVGQVAAISGTAVNGCYPILSIDSATTATVSILHDGLDAPEPEIAPVGTSVGLHVAVRTFSPQRQIVSELLAWMSGIRPETSARVMNAQVLRRPCALGTLQMIYNAMAAAAPANESADLVVRAELYERLYRKSLRGVVVELDLDGDGRIDSQRSLQLVQFARV